MGFHVGKYTLRPMDGMGLHPPDLRMFALPLLQGLTQRRGLQGMLLHGTRVLALPGGRPPNP